LNIVIIHTDFRIYWPFRLVNFYNFLEKKKIKLTVIEIAGMGSPYSFNKSNNPTNDYWMILFPDKKIEDLDSSTIKKRMFDKLDEIKPDVIIAGAIAFFSGAIATNWAVKNNKKLIIFDDAKLENVKRNFIVDRIKKNIYKNVNAIFCPAPDWDNTFKYFGFENEQIFYGVNVVDNNFWANKSADFIEIELPEKFILSVGRMIPKKNYFYLIAAYKEYISKTENPLALVIVGDGPEKNKINEFIKNEGLDSVYSFPFQSQERLRTFYYKASYFVLASKYIETWGLVVNEAMAAGLPVLLSNKVGCSTTLIVEGKNGYLFSPTNQNELTDILIKLHSFTDHQLQEMGKYSKKVIENWDINRFNSGLYDAIKFVLNNNFSNRTFVSRNIAKLWKGRYRPV